MSRRAGAALWVACLFVATSARAQSETVVVREGDTCRSIAIRVYGESEAIELLHEHNPELGPTPHRLVPGTTLRTPPPRPPAELSAVTRRVERRDPDASAFSEAHRGDPLARGAWVRTHESSSAEITFRDRARVTIREDTLVVVYGGARRIEERPLARAELERGALRSRMGELAGTSLEVQTPSSETTLGEGGVVHVDEDGTSQIANHGERATTVRAGAERVVLPGGTGVVVRRGEALRAPRRLLAAPRWRADHRGFVVGFTGRGGTLRGGFSPVRGAARYRVEVARQADGGDVVAVRELDAEATRVEISGVPEGTLYVSMASIDAEGLEGRRSPWRAFSVRQARLVLPGGTELGELTSAELDAADLPAAERLPEAPRVLPGTWVVSPRGLRCYEARAHVEGETPAEVEPAGIVTLREVGRHAIVCRDAEDNETAPVEVDVTSPHIALVGTLRRDRSERIELNFSGDPIPRSEVLRVRVPDGFRAERVRGEGPTREVVIHAHRGAAETVPITVELLVGSEHIALLSTTLPVRDAAAPQATSLAPPSPPSPPRDARVVASVLGDLGWPSLLSLRDERRVGVRGWAYLALLADAPRDPQVRVGGGAFGHVPDTPLRLVIASQGDVLGAAQPPGRRGAGDLYASLGALLFDEGSASLALDLGAFLPTRPEPESLGRVRLAPSAELSARPTAWLSLRTRQGALLDAAERGARLWAFAVGADVSIGRPSGASPGIGVGVELDGSLGDFADRSGAALTLGGGAELRYAFFELGLAARVALTDEARALAGEWSAMLVLRFSSGRRTSRRSRSSAPSR